MASTIAGSALGAVPFQGQANKTTFSGHKKTHFGIAQPLSASSGVASKAGDFLRPVVNACQNGLHEVKKGMKNTLLWTAAFFVLGFVPFLHAFLIPAVATFPVLAGFDFLKGVWNSVASEPALKSGFQSLAKTAKSTWESATKASTPPPAPPSTNS